MDSEVLDGMTRAGTARRWPAPASVSRAPALDGIRGLALISVMAYHAVPGVARGGFLGVEMFFVLSGFLLTSLLLAEHERWGSIDMWSYAGRRIRRIIPGLFVVLTALAVVGLFLAPEDANHLGRGIASSFAGLTNWHLIGAGSSYFGTVGRPPPIRHLWSIAVELQAYVLIPFVALFVARRSRAVAVRTLAALVAASALLMTVLARTPGTTRAYYGTDTRIGAIFTGALVALLLSDHREPRSASSRRTVVGMGCAAPIGIAVLCFAVNEHSRALYPAGFLAAQASAAALIVAATRWARAADVLGSRAIGWLGTRSYGIYLWHWPIVALVRPGIDVGWNPAFVKIAGAGAAVGLGALSYRFVEQPFLVRKAQNPRRPALRMSAVAAWATTLVVLLMLIARSAPVDPIAESLVAGQRALAEQEITRASPTVPTVDTRAETVRTAPVAIERGRPLAAPRPLPMPARRGPPPNAVRVTAVGDSVMLGAAARLKERLGSSSYVNAEVGRQFRAGVEAVKTFRKQGKLGPVLVVHLGNNGPADASDVDAMMRAVKGTVRDVLFVTVRVDKPWQDRVNDTLKNAANRYGAASLVNWYRASQGHRDWFYSDGTHLNRTGAQAYANLVGAAIPPPSKPKPKAKPKPKPTPTPGLLEGITPKP